jgi:ubiquinone/menaquinone biosynthesis C-methylase UbiE
VAEADHCRRVQVFFPFRCGPHRMSHVSLQSEYDKWHQCVHDADPGHDDASSPWYELVREYLGELRGLRILEVACGRGGFVKQLAQGNASVTGCDFSFAALRIAKQKLAGGIGFPPAHVVQGDAQNLPFVDNSFDVVVCCETIEHLPAVQKAISELYRVTKAGGKLLLTTPNYFNFMGLYEMYAAMRHPQRKDDQPFDRHQWFPQVHRWIRRTGWKIIATDGTVHQFPFFPGHNPVRYKAPERNKTVRKILSPFAYTYFVYAAKPSSR